ncbi:hypothetical protein EDD68_10792 [Melghiribacillus thermohalophilus]|uniref:Uncharacterized protein n=1 Tax=Melghiribacillus thermohalophilus TaxID=1324956 RepID=A0A4R3N2P9_9BACI|nr:DUF6731 family protein [Melghiribacillus thermohalophilus]TCT23378.1 hypothetical protein EDD68_10792 [Melghiribacillus thermohalophilus]
MERTIYFYNCFITHNNQITDIHISELMDEIRLLRPNQRLKVNNRNTICLMNMVDPTTNNYDHNDRKVVFGKFRDQKPYLGNMGTDNIIEINDDVLELTSIFYRRNSRLILAEYNHYGARPEALQKYLSSFLPKNEDDFWTVELEPVEPELGFHDIEISNDIRKVSFKVDLTARNRTIYANPNNQSVLGDILERGIETHNNFGANVAEFSFGNGRKRNRVIDSQSLVDLLRGLDFDGDVFESVRVRYKSPTTNRVENIDVKNQGVLKAVIDLENDGWGYICDQLEEQFYRNGRLGENDYLDYEYIPANLPEIIYNEE